MKHYTRAIWTGKDDDGKKRILKSQWFEIKDFDPVDGASQFDWSDGSYLGFDDIRWADLTWEHKYE